MRPKGDFITSLTTKRDAYFHYPSQLEVLVVSADNDNLIIQESSVLPFQQYTHKQKVQIASVEGDHKSCVKPESPDDLKVNLVCSVL